MMANVFVSIVVGTKIVESIPIVNVISPPSEPSSSCSFVMSDCHSPIVVWHPDYGLARCKPQLCQRNKPYWLQRQLIANS